MDAALGRFLDALRDEDVLSRATVVVVADHGEAFGEHGELTHGEVCYQTTMRVPFDVRHPDGARGGERSREIVSVADVAPTLAAALGLSLGDGDIDGQSLLAPVSAERGAYFESYQGYLQEGLSPLAGWLDREGKYLASSEPCYFDVWEDPAEERNVITERGDAVARARERIGALAAKDRLAGVEPDSIEDEILAQAQALGYAGTLLDEGRPLPDPLAPTSLPAPGRVTRARFALQQGRALVGSGRYAEAEPVLRDALAGLPEEHAPLALTRGSVWFNLGIVLLCGEPQRRDEALAAFRRALALDPRLDGELARLRALLVGRGREEDARFLDMEL
jgi:tetratricopeptide (TPR) repeat protein